MATIEIFTSPTCPHCPVAKEAVKKYANKNNIKSKDFSTATKDGQRKARQYNVMSVPTIIIKGEKETIGLVGTPSDEKLAESIAIADGHKEFKEHTTFLQDIMTKIKTTFKGEAK